jgi:hypothetical protein
MKRYREAFCLTDKGLPTPIEPPSKGVIEPAEPPSKPGSGSGTVTGESPPLAPSSDSPQNNPPPKRSGPAILSAFGSRWQKAERKLFIKGRFDERDACELAETINGIPNGKDRDLAWAELEPAIDRYLGTKKPFYEGHPFATFIKDLASLRTNGATSVPTTSPAVERNRQQWAGR